MKIEESFEGRLSDALKRNHLDLKGTEIVDEDPTLEEAEGSSGLAYGMRMGVEFLAGTVVGLLLGWGLDKAFGTMPWFLLLFTGLGFAAGLLNVYRDMMNIQESIGINREKAQEKALTKPSESSTSVSTD